MPDYLLEFPDGTTKRIRSDVPLTDKQLSQLARDMWPQMADLTSGEQSPTPQPEPELQVDPEAFTQFTLGMLAGSAPGTLIPDSEKAAVESQDRSALAAQKRKQIEDLQGQERAHVKRIRDLESRARSSGGAAGAQLQAEAEKLKKDIRNRIRPRMATLSEEIQGLRARDVRPDIGLGTRQERAAARVGALRQDEPIPPAVIPDDPLEQTRLLNRAQAEREAQRGQLAPETGKAFPLGNESLLLTGAAAAATGGKILRGMVEDPVETGKTIAIETVKSAGRLAVKLGAGFTDPRQRQEQRRRYDELPEEFKNDITEIGASEFGKDVIEDVFDLLVVLDAAAVGSLAKKGVSAIRTRIANAAKKAGDNFEAAAVAAGADPVEAAKAGHVAAQTLEQELLRRVPDSEDFGSQINAIATGERKVPRTAPKTAPEAPETPPKPPPPTETPPSPGEAANLAPGVAVKNDATFALRTKHKLSELADTTPEEIGEWVEKSKNLDADDIVQQTLAGRKGNWDEIETTAVGRKLSELDDQATKAAEAFEKAKGTPDEVKAAERLAEVLDKVDDYTNATRMAGSPWGRTGVARQVFFRHDGSFTASVARATRNAKRPLTKGEIAELQDAARDVETAAKKLAAEDAASDAAAADLFVQELSKAKGKAKGVSGVHKKVRIEQIRKERLEAMEALVKKWKEIPDDGLLADPFLLQTAAKTAQRLAHVSPEIVRIAKTYFEEGIVEVGALVRKVRRGLRKAGIDATENEIRAILGRQVTARAARKERSAWVQMRDRVQSEFTNAKMRLAEQERKAAAEAREAAKQKKRAEAAKAREAAAEARRKRMEAERAERAYWADVRRKQREWESGKKAEAGERAKEYKEWWKNNVGGQRAHLLNRTEKVEQKIDDMMKGVPPQKRKKVLYDDSVSEQEIAFEAAKRRQKVLEQKWGERGAVDTFIDIAGIPKSLVSGVDASAPFIQGLLGLFTDTGSWARGWAPTLRVIKQKGYERFIDEFMAKARLDPEYQKVLASKVDLPIITSPGEEAFVSHLASKLPHVGLSQREYDAFLTAYRFDVARQMIRNLERSGKPLSLDELKAVGRYVNNMSGRGFGGLPQQYAKLGSAVFFAPKLWASLFEFSLGAPLIQAAGVWRKTGNPRVFKAIAKKYVRAYTTVLGAAFAANEFFLPDDWQIELRPNHTDFGRITHTTPEGETITIDAMPRPFREVGRFLGRAALGRVTRTSDKPLKSEFQFAQDLGFALTGKAAPVPSTLLGINYGESFGESFDVGTSDGWLNIAKRNTVPISIQNAGEIAAVKSLDDHERAILYFLAFLGSAGATKPREKKSEESEKPMTKEQAEEFAKALTGG